MASLISVLPRYPIEIYSDKNIKYCGLIRRPAIDIPIEIYLFVFECKPILSNFNSDNKEKIKNLWKQYKKEIKINEKQLNIPILTWNGNDMFTYFLKENKNSNKKYTLYLKVKWKIFLDYLENWPKLLLLKEKEHSVSKLYGWLAVNWRMLSSFKYITGNRSYQQNIDKSLIVTGDYYEIEYICLNIINILTIIEKNIDSYTPLHDIIKQVKNVADELKKNILDGNIYSSYFLLRNLSENLARCKFLIYFYKTHEKVLPNYQEIINILCFSYIISTFFQKNYRWIEIDNNSSNLIRGFYNNDLSRKIQNLYIDFQQGYKGWYDLFEFQLNHNVPVWQVKYKFVKEKIDEKLGIILEITSKILHGNIALPPTPSLLEFKFFKHLLSYFLDSLMDFLKSLNLSLKSNDVGIKPINNLVSVNLEKIKKTYKKLTTNDKYYKEINKLISEVFNYNINYVKSIIEQITYDKNYVIKTITEIINLMELFCFDINDVYKRGVTYTYMLNKLEKFVNSLPNKRKSQMLYSVLSCFEDILSEIVNILGTLINEELNIEELYTLSVIFLHDFLELQNAPAGI